MSNALVRQLAKLVRRADKPRLLDGAVNDIFTERASAVNKAGVEAQINVILAADGIDAGAAIIRGMAQV